MKNDVVPVQIRGILPANSGCALFVGNDKKVFVINVEARYVDNGLGMDRYAATSPVPGGWLYYRTGSYKLPVKPLTVGVSAGVRW